MAEDLKAESTQQNSRIKERKKKIIIKERKKSQSGLPLLPQRENAECVLYDSGESYMESCLSNLVQIYIYLHSLFDFLLYYRSKKVFFFF